MTILSKEIKEYASSLGFDNCGISRVEKVEVDTKDSFYEWLKNSRQANMDFMVNYTDVRLNPSLLLDNAKSIICVILNYYPPVRQPSDHPQIAYYAYGKDYHDIMKVKLNQLLDFIKTKDANIKGRVFCDTAPILERYWAAKSGIGFIGKNSMLTDPRKGSYFFLGELIIDKELGYDQPLKLSCGNCTRCMDACPTKAIEKPYTINSNKCISYQTIENRGEIAAQIIPFLNNCVYGCDVCQQVCPWNKFAVPHNTKEFNPTKELLELNYERLINLTEEEYRRLFKGSAVKRAKYKGLKRNTEALYLSRKK